MRRTRVLGTGGLIAGLLVLIAPASGVSSNPINELQATIKAGKAQLEFDTRFGYLNGLLKTLKIPVSSQTLVFSKTSLQTESISPATPRAIYFNDDVYVGWVPHAST